MCGNSPPLSAVFLLQGKRSAASGPTDVGEQFALLVGVMVAQILIVVFGPFRIHCGIYKCITDEAGKEESYVLLCVHASTHVCDI